MVINDEWGREWKLVVVIWSEVGLLSDVYKMNLKHEKPKSG
jgi:hypothetical protein